MHANRSAPDPLDVVIIGAGFGGLGLGIRLDKAGISNFLILDKGHDVGGTWRDNHYPGAACDVPSHLYSFSFEPKADWRCRYAGQAEILEYMQHCVRKYQLGTRLRLGREVSRAEFDAASGLWRVICSNGELFSARCLVSACGQLNRPIYPQIDGRDSFAGPAFHSACWQHEVDLQGKRVAVIGTGASAIQFVPPVAEQAAELLLFQRSAAYVISKDDAPYSPQNQRLFQRLPILLKLSRSWHYLTHEIRALAFIRFPGLMKLLEKGFHAHLRQGVSNPEKRRLLVPDYPMGCKRMLISDDFYPAIDQDKVKLVTEQISRITAEGIETASGQCHHVDVIIYGTGFAASDFLAPMQIIGLHGSELNQAWQSGAEAYKGISVSGFPNLFLLYGPNTNLGHNSIIYMLESQFNYVIDCIDRLQRHALRYMDVKSARQNNYNQELQKALGKTIWSRGCHSWYQTAEGKHTNNWPGYTFSYRHLTRHPTWTDYDFTG